MRDDPQLPPEAPTQQLAAARPVRERVPVAPPAPLAGAPVVDGLVLERLAGAIRSLRAAVAIVAAVAAAAAVLGFYALHEARKNNGGRPASRARVAQLEGRVTRLSRQLQTTRAAAGGADAAALRSVQQQLAGAAKASDLQTLRVAVAKLGPSQTGAGAAASQTQLDALTARVDKLSQQVQQMQQSSSGKP